MREFRTSASDQSSRSRRPADRPLDYFCNVYRLKCGSSGCRLPTNLLALGDQQTDPSIISVTFTGWNARVQGVGFRPIFSRSTASKPTPRLFLYRLKYESSGSRLPTNLLAPTASRPTPRLFLYRLKCESSGCRLPPIFSLDGQQTEPSIISVPVEMREFRMSPSDQSSRARRLAGRPLDYFCMRELECESSGCQTSSV